MAKYNVGGFTFTDEESAKKAAKEKKAVEYVLAQLKDADENTVLRAYRKLINQRMFVTPVGLGFLNQLRTNLLETGLFTEADVPEVYGDSAEPAKPSEPAKPAAAKPKTKKGKNKTNPPVKTKKEKKSAQEKEVVPAEVELARVKRINSILLIACITMGICIAGMFYINSTINSPTILNYEEQILDKYSAWEQDLTARENALREKEHQ